MDADSELDGGKSPARDASKISDHRLSMSSPSPTHFRGMASPRNFSVKKLDFAQSRILLGPPKKSLTDRSHHQFGAKGPTRDYLKELRGGLGQLNNAIGVVDAQQAQDAGWFERSMPGAYLKFSSGGGPGLPPAKLAVPERSDRYKKINKSYNNHYPSPRPQKKPSSPQKPKTPRNPPKLALLPQNPHNPQNKPNPAFKDCRKKLYFKSLHSITNNLPDTIGKVKTDTNIGINQTGYTRSSTIKKKLLTITNNQTPDTRANPSLSVHFPRHSQEGLPVQQDQKLFQIIQANELPVLSDMVLRKYGLKSGKYPGKGNDEVGDGGGVGGVWRRKRVGDRKGGMGSAMFGPMSEFERNISFIGKVVREEGRAQLFQVRIGQSSRLRLFQNIL